MSKNKKVIIFGILIVLTVIITATILLYKHQVIKDGNLNELQEHFDEFYDIENIDKESLGYALNQNVYIEVKKVKYHLDGNGVANIIVTAPDLEYILTEVSSDLENVEASAIKNQMQEKMLIILNEKTYEKNCTELEVNLMKVDGVWKFVYDEELGNAISCNVKEIYKKYVRKYLRSE